MATKKKTRVRAKRKVSRRKATGLIGKPDTSVLARYSPTDGANAHPDWVKNQFPTYIDPHTGHEMTSVREFTHAGHLVKITTSYRVEVDGQPIRPHLSVDEDGRVYTHATPFVTYASATDLMKTVIDAYPDSFSSYESNKRRHHGHNHPDR
jgi:hypothetical protein